jgi:hypothetical protein
MGAEVTIGVNLDTVYLEKHFKDLPAISKMPVHSVNILRHNLAKQSVKTADVVISPRDIMNAGLLGWSFFFDNDKAQKIIKEGERVTEEAIPQIKHVIRQHQFNQTRTGKLFSFFRVLRRKGRPISFNS